MRAPLETFVPSWNRNPEAFANYADPLERLRAVNAKSPPGLIDLHFQTVADVPVVLTRVLSNPPPPVLAASADSSSSRRERPLDWTYYRGPEAFDKTTGEMRRCVWLVTGAGNHTLQPGRALLFDVVRAHLRSTNADYRVAKDNLGTDGGFLLFLD